MAHLVVMCAGLAAGQMGPRINSQGVNLSVTTGFNGQGYLNIDGVQAATVLNVQAAAGDIQATTDALQASVTALQGSVAQMTTFQTAQQQCVSIGKLWDNTRQVCADPVPSGAAFATAARMLAAEQDIDGIELSLNQTGGQHTVCTICGINQYVSVPCTANTGTTCAPCPPGTFSRGGYAQQCIPCSDSVSNCGYATCTSATNANCQFCSQRVEDGAAFTLTQPNVCTQCGPTQYRNSNTTCQACPKEQTCAAATCQANSGVTKLTGMPSLSSVYGPALNGRTLSQYLSVWTDGVTNWGPLGIHTGTTQAEQTNPWFQVDIGSGVTASIDRIVLYNREGTWGCRTFTQNGGGCVTVLRNLAQTWTGANNGAVLGVSDSPLTVNNPIFANNPQQCTSPSSRNCMCGMLTRYNNSMNGAGPNTASCNGASGRYIYIGLPGVRRMLNFAELQVWGTYTPTSPGYSACTTPCTLAGCDDGNARCSGGISTARCTAGGCVSTITNGVAIGYVPSTGQCVACTNQQYRNSQGQCAPCPGSCNGQPCQVQSSTASISSTSQQPGTYGNQVSGLAIDTNPNNPSYSETRTGANPWWQAALTSSQTIVSVNIRNRQDNCGARLIQGNTGCSFGIVPAGSANDRDFNNVNAEGLTIKVSTQPCAAGQICPGTLCGRITRPSTSGWDYTVTCNQPVTGTYVTLQAPGGRRILQLANVQLNLASDQPTC